MRGRYWSGRIGFLAALALIAPTRYAARPIDAHQAPATRFSTARAGADILDLTGQRLRPFTPAGTANVLFFIATDCPISNSYAPEIGRICREYGRRGAGCFLMYEDVDTSPASGHLDDSVRKHLKEYGLEGIAAAVDRDRTVATRAGATRTPQAVVIGRRGDVRYRGRIDNFYAALGKPRQQVTEHDLRDALDTVLSGRALSKTETQALGCHIVNPDLLRKKSL